MFGKIFVFVSLWLSAPAIVSVGYLPNWSYDQFNNSNLAALSHLNIAFCNPNANGDINCDIRAGDLTSIVNKAHAAGLKVMASLGGGGGSAHYTDLTSDSKHAAFSQKIVDYVLANNFDGIDLDIEGEAENAFWRTYERWVEELSGLCVKNNLLLTTAVGQWYGDKVSNRTFTFFDFVTVMEYDTFATALNSEFGAYQPRINYYLGRGIPASKIVLGIPFFGETNPDDEEEIDYKQVIAESPDGWQTNQWKGFTYHNPKDVAAIVELSKKYGGVMIWELTEDLPTSNEHSLLKAVLDNIFK